MTIALLVLKFVLLSLAFTIGFSFGRRMARADDELLDEAFQHGYAEGANATEHEYLFKLEDAYCEGCSDGYDVGFEDGTDQVPVALELGADETAEAA